MGNYIFPGRPVEEGTLGAPTLRTPFTDVTSHFGHYDGDPECFPFEIRFIDCCEAHGRELAKKNCKYYFQDYIECARKWKQMERIQAMIDQRYHLWFKGIMGSGPRMPLFYETPRYDAYAPNFPYDDVHHKDV